jgi:hypothetical protein
MKLTEDQQENFARGMYMFAFIVATTSFALLLGASTLTILSVNVLFGQEVIPLTFATVFSLAWIKFWVGFMFNRIKLVKES